MSEILVVKLGGTTIADQAQVLGEVAAVARRRPVILVHGGGRTRREIKDGGQMSDFKHRNHEKEICHEDTKNTNVTFRII